MMMVIAITGIALGATSAGARPGARRSTSTATLTVDEYEQQQRRCDRARRVS